MVRVAMQMEHTDIPIEEIIEHGQMALFERVPELFPKAIGLPNNANGYKLLYNGKTYTDEMLSKITDDDVIRVVIIPEHMRKAPIDPAHKRNIDNALKIIGAGLRSGNIRRIEIFRREFLEPGFIRSLLVVFPKLAFDIKFLAVLSDWDVFYEYIIVNSFRRWPERNSFKYRNPIFMSVIKHIVKTIADKYKIKLTIRNSSATVHMDGRQVVTREHLQNVLNNMLRDQSGPSSSSAGVSQPASSSSQQSGPSSSSARVRQLASSSSQHSQQSGPSSSSARVRQPGSFSRQQSGPSSSSARVRQPASSSSQQPGPAPIPQGQEYASQAEMLRNLGYLDDELNMQALVQADGVIETAIGFIRAAAQ
ncbi:unnamed protein product [Caenorhabditis sp. 36 PRJEB53466]|nr:unnamed protein product [Caenorhabditis sp. 36 PRJEB53466]